MQINIQDIIPFMKKGWVAMDENGSWCWYVDKPIRDELLLQWLPDGDCIYEELVGLFDIAPADNWTKSLIKVGGK